MTENNRLYHLSTEIPAISSIDLTEPTQPPPIDYSRGTFLREDSEQTLPTQSEQLQQDYRQSYNGNYQRRGSYHLFSHHDDSTVASENASIRKERVDSQSRDVSSEIRNSQRVSRVLSRKPVPPPTIQQNSHPREGWPAWQWPVCLFIFCTTFTLIGYDVSNVANVQIPIYEKFGHIDLLPLVTLAYASMGSTVVPLVRKFLVVCDMRFQMMFYATMLFIGCTVCGAAESMSAIIAGRFVTGLGGAGMYQVTSTYVLKLTTPTEFSKINGLVAAFWATGLILGPIVGGAFTENKHATWRWAFYINLPLIAMIVPLAYFAAPTLILDPDASILRSFRELDWVGFVLQAAGIILLNICLVFSGSIWKWHSAAAAVWIVGGILLIAYTRQQADALFTTRERQYLPVDLFKKRMVVLAGLATSACSSVYAVTLYYTPLFFAFAKGKSPLAAAVNILPFTACFIVFVILSGGLLPIIRYYAPMYIFAGCCILVGGAVQTTLKTDTPTSRVMGIDALIGIGAGTAFQIGLTIMTQSMPAKRRLDAAVAFITMQLCGIAFGLGIAGAVYQNVGFSSVSAALAKANVSLSPEDVRDALAGADSRLVSSPKVAELTVTAVVSVIAKVNYMMVSAGAVILVAGFWMKWEALDFGRKTEGVTKTKEGEASV